jgi:hypothetical protein
MVRAFRHELHKLTRPTMLLGSFGVMVALGVLGVVIGFSRAASAGALASLSQPDGFATSLQKATVLLGVVSLGMVATAVAQDWSTGMLRSMLVREPRRLRLLAGKLAADLGYTAVAVLAGLVVALLAALVVGPSQHIDTSQWLRSGLGTTLSQLGLEALVALGFGALGAVLAMILRNPTAAVIVGVAWMLPVEGMLTRIWSSLEQWMPAHNLTVIADRGAGGSMATALLAAGGLVAAGIAASATLFRRGDVTA